MEQGNRRDPTAGSSPLARGTHHGQGLAGGADRFIPAGAGNTSSAVGSPSLSNGSSPLARGTLKFGRLFRAQTRFIPAGAGNTQTSSAIPPAKTVHPRWRGEHDWQDLPEGSVFGSSPLARGTRPRLVLRFVQQRFIPAGAGNTAGTITRIWRRPVHPRWRGEHCARAALSTLSIGSSPLARGTRDTPT